MYDKIDNAAMRSNTEKILAVIVERQMMLAKESIDSTRRCSRAYAAACAMDAFSHQLVQDVAEIVRAMPSDLADILEKCLSEKFAEERKNALLE